MNSYDRDIGLQAMQAKEIRQVTIREEIESQIKHLEGQLKIKNEMLTLLSENPAIERFMDLSRGYLR